MAKTIATIGGTALAPGVSKNARLYTKEAIAKAVQRAQSQLAGGKTLSVLTHHEAGDDSERIIGRITSMSLDENGAARFTADLADTPHARTIASLADNTSGQPFLSGMSIRGAWVGKVQRVKGPDGSPVETAGDLEFYGIDPTHKPGVEAAGVDAFAWAKGGTTETTERVLITESVQEARVTAITEETTPASENAPPAAILEAARAALPAAPHMLEDGLCVTCHGVSEKATNPMSKRGSGTSGPGGTAYADPGYQADKKQRYELDTPVHIRAAWSFISKAANAAKYTSAQLKRIKGRIKSAASKAGIQIAAEGWTIGPAFQVTEALAEYMGDPDSCGSYSLQATNGPTTVTVCSYGLDPADLGVILQQACTAAGLALCALDPDMDGDIDVPGADSEDTDGDAGGGADTTDQFDSGDGTADLTRRILAAIKGESDESLDALVAEARATQARDTEVTETSPTEDPAPQTEAAAPQETEAPAVSETTTTQETAAGASAAAPSFTQADIDAAVQRGLDADRAARKAAKATKKAKAAESAAPAAAPVTETAAPDIEKLVADGLAAALAAQGLVETTEQKVARLVAEGVTRAKQELAAQGGGPGRKGLVTETGTPGAAAADLTAASFMKNGKMIPMEQWSEEQRRDAGMALQTHVLGDRAVF